jgi:anti-sigma-K factor RskA
MSDGPDFRELAGDDLSPEERARLERVHDLLVAAGPPPELPPALVEPDVDPREQSTVAFLPRRRAGLMLGIAAAIALTAFLGGFIAGRTDESFAETYAVRMHSTQPPSNASATIHVGEVDEAGNWPLKLVVRGLPALRKGEYYEMFLTRGSDLRAASCGAFRIANADESESVRLNAPYRLRAFDGWVVTVERPGSESHPIVLSTA